MFDISSFSFSTVIRECARLRRLETTEIFAMMGCDDLKSKYLLEWVFFLNMDILKCPFSLLLTRQSRNGSSPTVSEVNWNLGDTQFIFSRNELCRSRFSTTKVSSTYLNHI
ncbi:unnamed protein product [Trichobilharzia szidati]|nr:unnamed protein product [Trichobilharzia szidati]